MRITVRDNQLCDADSDPLPQAGENIARRLTQMARQMPHAAAVAVPGRRRLGGQSRFHYWTFEQLDRDSDRLAAALLREGATPFMRIALMVRPSFEFVACVFGLFKAGAVQILIDPGMGARQMLGCLDQAQPEGFVAIGPVQAVRAVLARRYPKARLNVTVGRNWLTRSKTLTEIQSETWTGTQIAPRAGDDPAAIIFTTGSTGPPKGVLYRHRNFDQQVEQIRDFYGIRAGEIDVPCFPLFALFNCAMGVTAVIPRMDPTRPARVDPASLVETIENGAATQAFGSPAVWDRVGPHCRERGIRLARLKRVLSAGAPVPARLLETMRDCLADDGEMHTPYGATEALPVASIGSREVLAETATITARGGGICVGRRFSGIEWRVIATVDGAIASIESATVLKPAEPGEGAIQSGQVGELIVRGPVVTAAYLPHPTRGDIYNALGKIADPEGQWHRMGDVGYLDPEGRFWFCGRMAHRVRTREGTLFTIPCEAIFNAHARAARTALVGLGPPGAQRAVLVVEPLANEWPRRPSDRKTFVEELLRLGSQSPLTRAIDTVLFHRSFPVDIRHNAKIFREKLAVWAAGKLKVAP